MRILLTGGSGQVGWELRRVLAPMGEVSAPDSKALNLADPESILASLRSIRPEVIVNAAAYTAVDQAEQDALRANAVNAHAPGLLAAEAKRLGALLVHYSTDYVFDGAKRSAYLESDAPNPLSVYGASKLAGERAILAAGCRHVILRTSWVYGARGRNFLLTMLRLARERPELRVVSDQIGSPTWCRALAEATAQVLPQALADSRTHGLYHATNAGATSWCGFAAEILRLAGIPTPVLPIPSSDYPTPVARPGYSVLDNRKLRQVFGVELPEWQVSVAQCLRDAGSAA